MREIKFRAWNKNNNMMLEWDEVMNEHFNAVYDTDAIFMQYTGLKDKNGTEICDGDIVEYDLGNPLDRTMPMPKIRKVGFKNGMFCLIEDKEEYSELIDVPLHEKNEHCLIIGNIYENPELLEH